MQHQPSLDQQRELFKQRRFLAMPLAGMLVWAVIGSLAPFVSEIVKVYSVWLGCGSIFYLAIGLAKLTREDFFGKHRAKNTFDTLFLLSTSMCLMMFPIAMIYSTENPSSVPLTVGIIAGLMWLPFSWIIQHWVGYFHAIARTIGVLLVWFVFPEHQFEAISFVIVLTYAITLYTLEKRFQQERKVESVY
jgi:hypothetical protein